ncbi:MAG: AlpA family phage regulatory protein [Rhodospirillaceae bacterium]
MLDKILTTREVLAVVPYSRVHLWRLIGSGGFPAPIQLSERRVGFRESDISAWLASRENVSYASVAAKSGA